jgi:hypothetical protein
MLADALAAQKFTRKFFVVELDFTEPTIADLEAQCEAAKYALRAGLSPENIDKLTNLWGAYFGEVLRRHSSGQWGLVQNDGADKFALQTTATTVFPHDQIRQRLEQGPAANLCQAYDELKPHLQ